MRGQGGTLNDDDRLKRLSDLGSSGLAMDVEVSAAQYAATATTMRAAVPGGFDAPAPAAPAEALEQVLKFLTSPDDRANAPNSEGEDEDEENPSPKRDIPAALQLAVKVFEAVRAADERVRAADDFQRQLVETHDQQIRAVEARIALADKRAKAAEGRAREAESWLAKFHDNIVEDFQRTFSAR
jgi:hypothetical protein